jgi:hypothetical protein
LVEEEKQPDKPQVLRKWKAKPPIDIEEYKAEPPPEEDENRQEHTSE